MIRAANAREALFVWLSTIRAHAACVYGEVISIDTIQTENMNDYQGDDILDMVPGYRNSEGDIVPVAWPWIATPDGFEVGNDERIRWARVDDCTLAPISYVLVFRDAQWNRHIFLDAPAAWAGAERILREQGMWRHERG